MWLHTLNPTIVHLGSLEVRWYGLVYVLGFLLAAYWLNKHQEQLQLSKDQVWDLLFYLIIGVIAGARLFMLFWNPELYLLKPWNLLFIWQGGMSFHGGLVGIVVACWWYCKKKQLDFWKIADILSVPAMFALALGRIANFINGELWGRVWDGSWCVNFRNTGGGDLCRHPAQLYGAAQRFVVFFWLLWLGYRKQFTPGFIFWNFVLWEGIGRIIVDIFRENARFLSLSLGQWLSVGMVLAALGMFWNKYRDDWKRLRR